MSKKFELDKFLIKKIYNLQDKKKRVYNVTKKNVVYDKQLTEQYFKYSNNNKNNYYSSYQSFRDYISSGYNYDFLVNEINNVKSILGFSRNIRELINKKINPESQFYNSSLNNSNTNQNQNQIIELNEESSNEKINGPNDDPFGKLNKGPFGKQQKNPNLIRRASTVFQIDKENPHIKRVADFAHKNVQIGQNYPQNQQNIKKGNGKKDFLEICKLLKIKEEELKHPHNQYQFRLFSVMSEDFDPFFLPVYENFMNVKYENQKTKLIKLYNQEKAFIECVTSIKSKLKSHLDKEQNAKNNGNPNIIKQSLKSSDLGLHNFPQHKLQIKIPYINAFYFGRTEIYFKDIDNFMSMYKENTSLSTKRLEKDFFANLFKILTYNNADCKKFLQYLFTHSYFFKYIYNYFTYSDKNTGNTIKNFAPSIKKNKEEEHFLNDSMKQLFFTDDSKNKSGDENKLIIYKEKEDNIQKSTSDLGNEEYIETLIGNEFIYTINICEDDVSDFVNNKKINSFKKLLSNNKNFNKDYIITLNNNENENLLQIINIKTAQKQKKKKTILKHNKFLFSFHFDDKIILYDLENDIKNNIKFEKDKKKVEKYILIGLKENEGEYSHAYVFKLSKDIYNRFTKSIISKGNKIRKKELFGDEEESEEKSENQINLEDMMNEADIERDKNHSSSKQEIFDFDNESEKNNQKKKNDKDSIEKDIIKTKIRGDKKQLTFGIGAFSNFKKDNLNESDKNIEEENENDDEDKSDKSDKSENKDSSDEVKDNTNSDEEKGSSEENEDEDNEDKDDNKDDDNEKENDEDDDDDNDNDDNNDDNKNEPKELNNESNESKSEKNSEKSEEFLNKNQNEEEINTDINRGKDDNKSNSS